MGVREIRVASWDQPVAYRKCLDTKLPAMCPGVKNKRILRWKPKYNGTANRYLLSNDLCLITFSYASIFNVTSVDNKTN